MLNTTRPIVKCNTILSRKYIISSGCNPDPYFIPIVNTPPPYGKHVPPTTHEGPQRRPDCQRICGGSKFLYLLGGAGGFYKLL